jgi:hypothetical protein
VVEIVDAEPQEAAGWQRMRRLLADAGKPDVPGLYVSRACRFWWETTPVLPREPRRPEDVDTRGPDHGGMCRYACLHRPATFESFDPREIFDPVPESGFSRSERGLR